METRFYITEPFYNNCDDSIAEAERIYLSDYKKDGFIFSKDEQTMYFKIDKEILLQEKDRVDLKGTFYIIDWACLDLDNDIRRYYLEEE